MSANPTLNPRNRACVTLSQPTRGRPAVEARSVRQTRTAPRCHAVAALMRVAAPLCASGSERRKCDARTGSWRTDGRATEWDRTEWDHAGGGPGAGGRAGGRTGDGIEGHGYFQFGDLRLQFLLPAIAGRHENVLRTCKCGVQPMGRSKGPRMHVSDLD